MAKAGTESMRIGWVDFSRKYRDKALDMLKNLEHGAVDELGIGIIRDAFADRLFPGTSTLITRAKYYCIIPYIIRDALDKCEGTSGDQLLKDIDARERRAGKAMWDESKKMAKSDRTAESGRVKDAEGIIGSSIFMRNENGWVKRAPSELYWNGIRAFGICDTELSFRRYVKALYEQVRQRKERRALDAMGIGEECVDAHVYVKRCRLPDIDCIYSEKWKDGLCIDLTYKEAEFLKKKILEKQEGTLLAFLIEHDRVLLEDTCANSEEPIFSSFVRRVKDAGVGEKIGVVLDNALNFMKLVYAARVRYNYILEEKKHRCDGKAHKEAHEAWEYLSGGIREAEYVSEAAIGSILKICDGMPGYSHKHAMKTIEFIKNLAKAFRDGNLAEADKYIVNQEKAKKGEKRAKLLNPALVKDDKWIGGKYLDFRLPDVAHIVNDIKSGLEGAANVES